MINEIQVVFPNGVMNYSYEELTSIFTNEEEYRNVMTKVRENKLLFRAIHIELERINNNNIKISDELLSKLKSMNFFYNTIFTEEDFKENIESNELPYEIVKQMQEKRISKMNHKDTINDFVKKVVEEKEQFMLIDNFKKNEEANDEINSVSVITPSQIISRYNASSDDGQKGIGSHEENFLEILYSVYDKKFDDIFTYQDLLIRYVSSTFKGNQSIFVTLYIPKIINSTQKIALIELDKQISECMSETGMDVAFSAQVVEPNLPLDKTIVYELKKLSDILKIISVDDIYTFPYEEKNFVGDSNLDFSYSKSNKKIK